jgi:hypothetical protein
LDFQPGIGFVSRKVGAVIIVSSDLRAKGSGTLSSAVSHLDKQVSCQLLRC